MEESSAQLGIIPNSWTVWPEVWFAVHALISQAKTAPLTPARLLHYQNVLLTMCHVTLKRRTVLKSATLLLTEDDGEPHDCAELVELVLKPSRI